MDNLFSCSSDAEYVAVWKKQYGDPIAIGCKLYRDIGASSPDDFKINWNLVQLLQSWS